MTTALAEALLAAQRQAVGALSKGFVAGAMTPNELYEPVRPESEREA